MKPERIVNLSMITRLQSMKETHPFRVSLTSALIIVVLFDAVYVVYHISGTHFDWKEMLLYDMVLFPVCFVVILYAVKNFLYKKIKLIYKIIHRLKTKGNEASFHLFDNEDPVKKVEGEVAHWAEQHTQEIEELKKMEVYRREFLGNVSHELKTPLFTTQGYIATLLDGGIHDPEININYLQRAEKNIDRMIAIVRDLEEIAKLESREIQLNFQSFDIIDLILDVIDSLSVKAAREQVHVYLHKEYDHPVYVYGDKESIRRVLINLIDNSINYCDRNKPIRKTKISLFDMDENYLIEVADNGIGIAEEHLPRVFERFYRTDKARSREKGGTGLGLAIVKHIMEAHQQTIHVRSTEGVGSTFSFTLKKA